MQESRKLRVTTPSDREILMVREFAARRELVFRAYTDASLIPKWWGLRAHTTSVDKMDVRVGGQWRFVCRDEEGNEFAFRGVYKEIVPHERLVYTFEFEPMAGHVMTETLTFEDLKGRTRMTTRDAFASTEDRDGMIAAGMEQGANESCERLDELLAMMA